MPPSADCRSGAAARTSSRSPGLNRTVTRECKSCEFYSLCQTEFRGLDASFIRKTEYQTQKDPRHIHIKRED